MADAKTSAKPETDDDTTPRFVTGSTMRHTIIMTATGSIGLVAIFIVDFANLFTSRNLVKPNWRPPSAMRAR